MARISYPIDKVEYPYFVAACCGLAHREYNIQAIKELKHYPEYNQGPFDYEKADSAHELFSKYGHLTEQIAKAAVRWCRYNLIRALHNRGELKHENMFDECIHYAYKYHQYEMISFLKHITSHKINPLYLAVYEDNPTIIVDDTYNTKHYLMALDKACRLNKVRVFSVLLRQVLKYLNQLTKPQHKDFKYSIIRLCKKGNYSCIQECFKQGLPLEYFEWSDGSGALDTSIRRKDVPMFNIFKTRYDMKTIIKSLVRHERFSFLVALIQEYGLDKVQFCLYIVQKKQPHWISHLEKHMKQEILIPPEEPVSITTQDDCDTK
jgi:hypothetical protein